MLQRSRVLAIATLMTVLFMFLGLGVWLFMIQVCHRSDYISRLENYYFKPVNVSVPRGTIYDVKGEVLATSIPTLGLWADPDNVDKKWTTKIDERNEVAAQLADLFDTDFETFRRKLDRTTYVCLRKRIIDPDILGKLYQLKSKGKLRGVDFMKSYCRCYPHDALLGHTLGFVNHENTGVFGMEAVHDGFLKGRPGSRVYRKDGVQNEIFCPDEPCERGIPGGDLQLTIDTAIQFFVEAELARAELIHRCKWAAMVVLEPRTGRILAAASLPGLNPSDPATPPYECTESHWMNRAFMAEYTPGSTFKPLVMATALDRGTIGLHQTIDSEGGHWSYKGRRINDTHPVSTPLDPAGVLVHSSNVGMSKVALSMVPPDAPKGSVAFQSIRDTLSLLGFGRCPGILSEDYESPGRVTPLRNWTRKYTLVSVSFGNEISVTPIQMAAAFAVLANDGLYIPPRLVERMVSPDGTQITQPAAPACRVFSAPVCREVRDMLVRVVEEGGSRHVKIKGVKVAGKTGTAEKLPARKEVTSSFVGFAPADDPALLALVVIDEPKDAHLASKVAAPHVMAVLERGLCHLGITGTEQACAGEGR